MENFYVSQRKQHKFSFRQASDDGEGLLILTVVMLCVVFRFPFFSILSIDDPMETVLRLVIRVIILHNASPLFLSRKSINHKHKT